MSAPDTQQPAPAVLAKTAMDASGGEADATPTAPSAKSKALTIGLRYVMVLVLVILALVSDVLYPGFFEWGNIKDILIQNAPVGLVAVGMTFVIIGGGFDLSVSSIFAGGAVLFASFSNHTSLGVAFVGAIAAGLLAGGFNGLIITKGRINPFIATLATSSLFAGAVLVFANNATIEATKSSFTTFGTDDFIGLPIVVWVLAVGIVAGGWVLARTVYGRSLYAIGGNAEAARLAGIRVDAIRASTYCITGVCAAIAGMMLASQTSVGQPGVGATITLDSIAIVIIGGTSLMGGEGAMWRTLVGLLILGTINGLFNSLGLQESSQLLAEGAIVLLAVGIESATRRRRR
jgi:ribose transport system permease protein